MKQYLTLALLGFLAAGLQLNLKADNLKITSDPREQTYIDYNVIFSPSDMDGEWAGNFGPHYSEYDLAARNEAPSVVVDMLEKRYQKLKNTLHHSNNIIDFLFPSYSFSSGAEFKLDQNKISVTLRYGFGEIFYRQLYLGNPLTTAASHGRLDIVKGIVEWIKQKLEQHNALDKLRTILSAPGINFGVNKTKGCLIIGTALIFALVNEEYEIVQYLLDQGAIPEGALVGGSLSPDGKYVRLAQTTCSERDGFPYPEDILFAQLILNAKEAGKLKLDPKLEASLKKIETDRLNEIKRQEEEKRVQAEKDRVEEEKQKRNREEYERVEKNSRLNKLTTALNMPKETLLNTAQKTILHDACKAVFYYPEFFEKVLKERPDLVDIIENGAIGFTNRNGYEGLAAELRNKLATIREKFGTPATRLQNNIKANNIAAVKAIIEENPELINEEVYDATFGKMTPVLYSGNKLELLKYLESKGADIHAQNNILLDYAVGSGSMEVTQYLVEKKGFVVTPESIEIAKKHGFYNLIIYLELKQK